MPNVGGGKKSGEQENRLLKDVEAINKALYAEISSSRNSNSSISTEKSRLRDPKSSKEGNSRKNKKSKWSWMSLRALSLSRNRRFNCRFSLQIHLIEGLPLSFDGSCLCVYWKRKDTLLVTPPAKAIQGVAEFQDILTHTCSIYGSRSGPHHSAKYEAKHFLLYASVLGAQELDLGKQRVDLTRFLPLTLEELQEEKNSGKWTTSFRLSGRAKGAVMSVSFGYVVVGDNPDATIDYYGGSLNALSTRQYSMDLMDPDINPSQVDNGVRHTGSLSSFTGHYDSFQNVDELKDLHEVLPSSNSAPANSVDISNMKYDEENMSSPLHDKAKLEVFKESLEPIKLAAYLTSDTEKIKAEENPCSEEKTYSPVHDRPEFDMFPENLETIKPDSYPLNVSGIENTEECEDNGFSVVYQSIRFSSNKHVEAEESIVKTSIDVHTDTVDSSCTLDNARVPLAFQDSAEKDSLNELNDGSSESTVVHEFSYEKDDVCSEEFILQELESALKTVLELEATAMESPDIMEAKSEHKMKKSRSLDDATELIASEFLRMLGIDHSSASLSFESDYESPREQLLRQFEKDALSEGFSMFDFDTCNDIEAGSSNDASFGSQQLKFSTGIKAPFMLSDLQKKHLIESEGVRSRQKAQMLEDLETEALMRDWNLNEKAFQHSPPKEYTGFGSPIHLLPEEPLTLPPLAEGFGPFLQTKDGGFLRSMNSSLFSNSKSGGNLIMQVSNPIVMPAEMGSGIMDILECLASVGIEKLSMQAKKLMPLEDISGKTMQQILREAKPVLEGTHRQYHLQHDLVTGQNSTCMQRHWRGILSGGLESDKFSSSSTGSQRSSEFDALEDLAPLAMDKIEALSLEGLRIQAGMSEEEAPSNTIVQSFMDGAAALQLVDIKDTSDGVDGIMGLSLTLDEWIRLDSGEIDDIHNISEHTSKLLAAHHANSFDLVHGCLKGEMKHGTTPTKKYGLLGNNFTVALMVQLRDPLRNYETVGTPMLALIQAERVFVPPKQKVYRCVSRVENNIDDGDEDEIVARVEMKDIKAKNSREERIPQFRIAEVHVAGLKTRPHRKKLWGTMSQQQSASRWLIASGMGKTSKNTTNVQLGDTLWSISSRIYGNGTK